MQAIPDSKQGKTAAVLPRVVIQTLSAVLLQQIKEERAEKVPFCPNCPESHLFSSIHSPIPFPSPALCTSVLSLQHSITAAWSPGDVSLLRSDVVVGYANRPARPLLLTRPISFFSGLREKHTHNTHTTRTHTETRTLIRHWR